MKTIISIVINAIVTSIVGCFVLLILLLLLGDIVYSGSDFIFGYIAIIIGNAFLVGGIHAVIFLPTIAFFQKKIMQYSFNEVYERLVPILCVLLFLYALIVASILGSFYDAEDVSAAIMTGIALYAINSLGLYMLLKRIKKGAEREIPTTGIQK